jgi:hypothetical protein
MFVVSRETKLTRFPGSDNTAGCFEEASDGAFDELLRAKPRLLDWGYTRNSRARGIQYEDGSLGELFINDVGKEGSTLRGALAMFAMAASLRCWRSRSP